MTSLECMTKIDELLLGLKRDLRAEAERLLLTQAVAVETYENDYRLPKILLAAAMVNIKANPRQAMTADTRAVLEILTKV